jgi:hypothetical protein
MKGLLKLQLGVVIVVASVAGTAQAGLISGTIQFSGGSTNDTMSLLTSKTLQSFTGVGAGGTPVVQYGDSGDFSTVPGNTPVTFNPFTYTGPGTVLPVTLWSFISGGETFSFVANSITSVSTSEVNIPNVGLEDFLNIKGTGTVSIAGSGLTPTLATFTITESGPPGSTTAFSFAESVTVVPEPSVLALGALAAVPFAWRFVRKAGRK